MNSKQFGSPSIAMEQDCYATTYVNNSCPRGPWSKIDNSQLV